MLTPQEVSNRAFSKAVMGGYNMAMVDEFLDELTADYTALFKENATLKAKLKVLVDKVEEYRATEDSMRAALLEAQKMAKSLVDEAEKKKEAMLADAQAQAKLKIGTLKDEIEEEQLRLDRARAETAQFVEKLRGVYQHELDFLDTVPDLKVRSAPAQPPEKETDVSEIEARILASFAAAEEKTGTPAQSEAAEEILPEESAPEQETPAQEAEEDPENTFVRMLNHAPKLQELKFGRNYRSEE